MFANVKNLCVQYSHPPYNQSELKGAYKLASIAQILDVASKLQKKDILKLKPKISKLLLI